MKPERIGWAVGLAGLAAAACAAEFRVAAGETGQPPPVERVGPPTLYMPDLDRYSQPAPDARRYPIPREAVTRDTYMRWIEESGHLAYADGDAPTRHGSYGPRHFTPVLARYVQTGDPRLGQACVTMLKTYLDWMRQEVERSGWHSNYTDEPGYLGLYRRYLKEGGLLDPDREDWFRELILFKNRTMHVWGTAQTYWRGPMHRAQGEGVSKGLAARWYPDAPEAAVWKQYAETVYQDWWRFKDHPPNDTGYYYGILQPLFLRAWLVGDDEFFKNPGMREVWDRLLHEVSPDGIILPYGAHGGWNSTAGTRIYMLELLAAKTGDGRYRFAAHKLMNYLLYQQDRYRTNHMLLGPETTERIALAYLAADDSIRPVTPEAGSRILWRKETLRLRNKQAAEKYLGPLDPAPDRNQICCNLIVTDRRLPAKLVLRSGWDPGDFFVLVDLFVRHDPVNAPGILGMTRWGTALGMAMNAKGSSQEGRLAVDDLGGTASLRHNTQPELNDVYYQEIGIPAFEDLKKATFATVAVSNYAGLPVAYTRELAFVKNRFLAVRDTALFEESFLACVSSVYNTQNVGPQVGDHWANTYFSMPRAHGINLKNPTYDLLVYFARQPDRRLSVVDRTVVDARAADVPAQLRYSWQGVPRVGQKLTFTQILYPHPASRKLHLSNAPGEVDPASVFGGTGAENLRVLRDDPEATVILATFEPGREEWILFNPGGVDMAEGRLASDARFAYVDIVQGQPPSVSAADGRFLAMDGQDVFRREGRGNFEP